MSKKPRQLFLGKEDLETLLREMTIIIHVPCMDAGPYDIPDLSFYDAKKRTYAVHSFADAEHEQQISTGERDCPVCVGDTFAVKELRVLDCGQGPVVFETQIHTVRADEVTLVPDPFREGGYYWRYRMNLVLKAQ